MPWTCSVCTFDSNADNIYKCEFCDKERVGFDLFSETKGNSLNKTKDSLVFTFGRFQPPTIGHKILFDEVSRLASEKNADAYVFVVDCIGGSCDKNPLSIKLRINVLKKMYPSSNLKFVAFDKALGGFDQILQSFIETQRYPVENITVVEGSDRVGEFTELTRAFIREKEEKIQIAERALEELRQTTQLYAGKQIQVVQGGQTRTDENTGGPESMSATKIRKAAIDGNKELFNHGVMIGSMTPADALQLMNEIRRVSSLQPLQGGGKRKTKRSRKNKRTRKHRKV